MTGLSRCCLTGVFTVLAVAAAAADTSSILIGSFKGWSAFQSTVGGAKVCYALAQPKTSEPKKARDPIYFLVSDWPARRAKAELQIIPGYPYKAGGTVVAQVGADKFHFFTQNDAGAGKAWIDDPDEEHRLVDAMAHGAQIAVTGTSQRGTTIRDTYSLDGLSAALDKVHEACGM